jgi:hypothetical protein
MLFAASDFNVPPMLRPISGTQIFRTDVVGNEAVYFSFALDYVFKIHTLKSAAEIAQSVSDGLQAGQPTNWGSIPDSIKNFFSLYNVQTSSAAYPASYRMGSRGSLLGGKAAEA